LDEPANAAQRGLQIVGCYIGELLVRESNQTVGDDV
jgi:hypothetical protein